MTRSFSSVSNISIGVQRAQAFRVTQSSFSSGSNLNTRILHLIPGQSGLNCLAAVFLQYPSAGVSQKLVGSSIEYECNNVPILAHDTMSSCHSCRRVQVYPLDTNVTIRRESATRINDYSYRHGKELLKTLHPKILKEVEGTLGALEPFPHGAELQKTARKYIADAFADKGWSVEAPADFSTDKSDYLDLAKWKVAMEMEFSRFEMFFRDFFRFMLLYERREIDVGIILTLDDMAYERWEGKAKPYQHARASLRKVIDFLEGDYRSIIRVPLWCIGIE